MQKIDPPDNPELTRKKNIRGFLYAAGLITLLSIIILFAFWVHHTRYQQTQVTTEYTELREMTQLVNQTLFLINSDLEYFTQNSLTKSILKNNNTEAKQHLTDFMLRISTIQKKYDQLRILDKTGQEIIRINHQPGSLPFAVEKSQLQNKANRYYFKETIKLPPRQIYTSPLDLNMENGVIERPLKPVIRFAMPIYDNTGTLLGIGIINYLGKHLLSQLSQRKSHSLDTFFLLNTDGYCLKGPDPENEWAFLLLKNHPPSFPQKYPATWKTIKTQQTGDIMEGQGHFFFNYISLSPSKSSKNKQPLILILHVPRMPLWKQEQNYISRLAVNFLMLAPLLSFLGWKLGTYQVNQKHLFHILEHEATHDPLTELYNRKAIHDILQRSMILAQRRQSPLALGYLDIDGLKQVNDKTGHEAGDQMIRSAAHAIRTIIRNSDSAARIGGDEFLIIFPDCDAPNASIVLERIKLHFADQGLKKNDRKWWISVGCTELLAVGDSIDHMIERADKKMYEDKHLSKCQPDHGDTSSISVRN
jgi:diguanylate cyclase (GGDEF)-like protein